MVCFNFSSPDRRLHDVAGERTDTNKWERIHVTEYSGHKLQCRRLFSYTLFKRPSHTHTFSRIPGKQSRGASLALICAYASTWRREWPRRRVSKIWLQCRQINSLWQRRHANLAKTTEISDAACAISPEAAVNRNMIAPATRSFSQILSNQKKNNTERANTHYMQSICGRNKQMTFITIDFVLYEMILAADW